MSSATNRHAQKLGLHQNSRTDDVRPTGVTRFLSEFGKF